MIPQPLSVPKALEFMEGLVDGGWEAIRRRNRALVLEGRNLLADALGVEPPASDEMIGHLAALPLPDAELADQPSPLYGTKLQQTLLDQFQIEVPIVPWPRHPQRVVRVSAALYNSLDDYQTLAEALRELNLCS